MTKPAVYQTAAAILLAACIASNIYLNVALVRTKSLLDNSVSIENYNQLVRAETNNAGRLTKALQDDRARLQQLTQLSASNQTQWQQLAAVTNLYEKTGEIEARLEALNAEDEGIRNFEQKQADSTSSMGHKFSALEKAVIKLSLAVQEAQFASQITVVTNPATSPATNGANATNPDAEQ
jgi:hypothetical protein